MNIVAIIYTCGLQNKTLSIIYHCLWVSCLFFVKFSFYLYTLWCIDITNKEAKTVCVALFVHDLSWDFNLICKQPVALFHDKGLLRFIDCICRF